MAVINFDGFRQMIDALGGMKIDVDMDMRYKDSSDGTDINLTKGLQQLNGKQTLDFVRYRESNEGTAESSDLDRNKREEEVLNQILNKLTSFSGITQWSKLLDIAGNSIKTDIPESKLRSWIVKFNAMKPQAIHFNPIVGNWVNPYVVPKESQLRQSLNSLRQEIGLTPLNENYPIAEYIGVDSSS